MDGSHVTLTSADEVLRQGLAAGRALLKHLEELDQDIRQLHEAFDLSQRVRQRHLKVAIVLLYLALAVNVGTLVRLIVTDMGSTSTVYMVAVATLPLVLVVLLIVLHGMTSGKVIPVSLGMVRAYAEDLQGEFTKALSDLIPAAGSAQQAHERMLDYISGRESAPKVGDGALRWNEWQRFAFAERQLISLAAEVRTARATAQLSSTTDLAVSSYGFAFICAAISTIALFTTNFDGGTASTVLAIVSAFCGLACYLIVRRPTNTQFHIEEALKRLGFSAAAVAQRLRAGVAAVPAEYATATLLQSLAAAPAAPEATPGPSLGASS